MVDEKGVIHPTRLP